MVINFNLLLVWLPMCKYTLTRLACSMSRLVARKRHKLSDTLTAIRKEEVSSVDTSPAGHNWLATLHKSACREMKRLNCLVLAAEIKSINSFHVAVDNCTSLHTICATTITLASVIHTIAHLMNVVNFSKRFDPFLGNLNMAEYRGQNPLQLLVSVPGITGCFMIIILLLMSLSSIHFIRNSSFDLFQIFHRLSIVFVILLILHPSSHVLKEQSNVDRHHPDFCYNVSSLGGDQPANEEAQSWKKPANTSRSLSAIDSATHSAPSLVSQPPPRANVGAHSDELLVKHVVPNASSPNSHDGSTSEAILGTHYYLTNGTTIRASKVNHGKDKQNSTYPDQSGFRCADERPKFVIQSSICWYVLSIGLSCYLLDLILRRLRRSKSSIELLEAKTNSEENLIELVLSNNHERFNNWLPGQYVYLNCPQIAAYEWHPFTISSMDDVSKRFTLHIKTSGDWTRKLRSELEALAVNHARHDRTTLDNELAINSLSMLNQLQNNAFGWEKIGQRQLDFSHQVDNCGQLFGDCTSALDSVIDSTLVENNNNSSSQLCFMKANMHEYGCIHCRAANFDRFNCPTVQFKVGCKRLPPLYNIASHEKQHDSNKRQISTFIDHFGIESGYNFGHRAESIAPSLELFVDGPFHSPFERLLEQQVSVCISNGVGWTAFSSVFQRLSSQDGNSKQQNEWWSKWNKFTAFASRQKQICPTNLSQCRQSSSSSSSTDLVENGAALSPVALQQQRLSAATAGVNNLDTKLHLMIIVTTIEQLRPFYKIALKYFRHLQSERSDTKICIDPVRVANVVREVTVFLTRSKKGDESVKLFCQEENLSSPSESAEFADCDTIKINDIFSIHFGKPNLDEYLRKFSQVYANKRKISVYCCGSYQVKRIVEGVCRDLNRRPKVDVVGAPRSAEALADKPIYCYHEENF